MRVDVVGAGPAGLAVAMHLLQASPDDPFDVHVWDRNRELRTTPCGEGIHVDRLALLPGFDSRPYVGAWLEGIAVDAPGARRLLLAERCATMRRSDWLPAMADHVQARGAKFHLGNMLNERSIEELPGDVVVGADGPSSRVSRLVGNTRGFTPAAQIRIDATPELDGRLIFLWDPEYSDDYAWVFPRGDHTSVGALATANRATFDRLRALASRYGVEGRVIREESYPIPFGGTVAAKGRYALVGDAAGVANPLTKGGMGPAFIQAGLLSKALADGGLKAYSRACARSPIYSNLPRQALDAMHRLKRTDVQRIVGADGPPRRLGTRTTFALSFRTAATMRPRLWRDASLLVKALRHAVRWGW